jgi:hypothetical protein
MFVTSAVPTKKELAVIAFAAGPNFAVTRRGKRVLLTLESFDPSERVPLVSWAFSLGTAADFSGDLLSRAVILAGTCADGAHSFMQEHSRFSHMELVEFARTIASTVQERVLAGGELRCEYFCLHTAKPSDWRR